MRYLAVQAELAEFAEVLRYLARYLSWQPATSENPARHSQLLLAEVLRYLARYLGWQRAKILGHLAT